MWSNERCDKETGKPGKWTQCKRKAAVTVQSKAVWGLFMHYCAEHAPKGYNDARKAQGGAK